MRSLRTRLLTLAAIPALALGAALATAGAASASDNGTGSIDANNYQCGGATNLAQSAGFIIVHQTDATHVSINYHLQDAAPNTAYVLYLYDGYCNYDTYLGTVTTDNNGGLNANFKDVSVPAGTTEVFTLSFDTPYTGSLAESVEVSP